MHLKYWIETCLKDKRWTLAKLQKEIEAAETTKIKFEYDSKLAKINNESTSEETKKIKIDLLNIEFEKYFERDENGITSYKFMTAGIGIATLSRIKNSRLYYPHSDIIKKIELVLGSFEKFLIERVYDGKNYSKGVCFEELVFYPASKKRTYDKCLFCNKDYPINEESGLYPAHQLIISSHKTKLPIAWEHDPYSLKGSSFPGEHRPVRNCQFKLTICTECRNDYDHVIKKPYQELLHQIKKSNNISQIELAHMLNTTQPYVNKLLSNKIDYLKTNMAMLIHFYACKEKIGTNKEKFKERLRSDICDLLSKNRYIPKISISVEQDYRFATKIKEKHLKQNGSLYLSCSFLIKSEWRSQYQKKSSEIAVFVHNKEYSEGLEYQFIYFMRRMEMTRLCIITFHYDKLNECENPLEYSHFFIIDGFKLKRVSCKEILEL